MSYAFTYQDKVYFPNGLAPIPVDDVETRNRATEAQEIAQLKQAPERAFLYVGKAGITTWLGTVLDASPVFGARVTIRGFNGSYSTRRAATCCLFGVRYVGIYCESSGDYCRLRKAKVQR